MIKKQRNKVLFFVFGICLLVLGGSCKQSVENANSREWKLAFISDTQSGTDVSGVNTASLTRIVSDLLEQNAELVLVGGDLIEGKGENGAGLNEQYQTWLQVMSPIIDADIPIAAIPGNHEYWGDSAVSSIESWEQMIVPYLLNFRSDDAAMPGRQYSFNFRNIMFLGLNQNQYDRGDAPFYYRGTDVDFVNEQLAARDSSAQYHVIAFGHMPQFMLMWDWSENYKQNRDQFWDMLGDANCRLYLTGHSHLYSRGLATMTTRDKSFYQVICGTGGAELDQYWDGNFFEDQRIINQVWNDRFWGYLLITVREMSIHCDWRYINPEKTPLQIGDSFEVPIQGSSI
jgi:hypothetical protein